MYAPICIFAFKRPDTTQQMLNALKQCPECHESELFVFLDEARNDKDAAAVDRTRALFDNLEGFAAVHLFPARMNKGLASSIIDGVTQVLKDYEQVIVLEDDIVVAPDFLTFMNQALEVYKDRKDIWSISGYTPNLDILKSCKQSDVFMVPRAQSWGWASWRDRWELVDWEVDDYNRMKSKEEQRKFNAGGNDLYRTLQLERNEKIESWAIRWAYFGYRNNAWTVNPVITKTKNIGLGDKSSHKGWHDKRHVVELKNGKTVVDPNVQPNQAIVKAFKHHHDLGIVSKIGYFMRLHNLGYHTVKKLFH